MKHLVLTLMLSGLSLGIYAQSSLDLLTISGFYGFPSKYESPYEDQKATPSGALINVKLPIANPIHLHSFILQTGLYKRFGDERVEKNYLFDPGLVVNLRLVYNLSL